MDKQINPIEDPISELLEMEKRIREIERTYLVGSYTVTRVLQLLADLRWDIDVQRKRDDQQAQLAGTGSGQDH